LVNFFFFCNLKSNKILWSVVATRVAVAVQSYTPKFVARICATYLDLGIKPLFSSILVKISASNEIPIILFTILQVLTTFLTLTVLEIIMGENNIIC